MIILSVDEGYILMKNNRLNNYCDENDLCNGSDDVDVVDAFKNSSL